MRRPFFLGACVGALVFVQGLLVFRLPVRIHLLQMWALAWSGVFGLTLSSTFATNEQAAQSLTFAAIGLLMFYGTAALLLRTAYRWFSQMGVVGAVLLLLAVHVGLYLVVVKSMVV